jgi:hypothetical protein
MATILFPVGRMVAGSLKELRPRTEPDGRTPKFGKDGKPLLVCNFGVAIAKGAETEWSQTEWGQKIFEIGKTAEPTLHQSAAFAWKITDGDDTRPNKNGNIPVEQEGWARHWVLWFSQGWLPTLCNADGSVTLESGAIVPGQYVQVQADVISNKVKPPETPGLYLNPIAVALAADGDRITTEVNTGAVGFGGAPLPVGARPVEPVVPGFAAPTPEAATSAPPTATSAPPPPNAAFMAPPVPAAPPADPVTTAKANGATYAQLLAAGWTEALMREHGMIV